MISEEKNRQLTQVGAESAMGQLLRRYWWPVAGVSEFAEHRAKPLRLMGEELVLYRTTEGAFGLSQRRCPHRNADLAYGLVEEDGIRCAYHGWKFGMDGRCLEMPYEDAAHPERRMKDKVTVKTYRARAHAGVVWAYMGPDPVPEIPDYEFFNWSHGFREITITELPCNWFQCQENSIDPVHFEWMHEHWGRYLRGGAKDFAIPRHLKLEFDEFDYGFAYRRVREGSPPDDPVWTIGRVCLWPNALFTGQHVEWRVPIDDENTLSISYCFTQLPVATTPYIQEEVPTWHGPLTDANGRYIDTHVMNQDFIAWIGQGRISDRTQEHLGRSDEGIKKIRQRYLKDAEAVARGEDPKAIVRDPAVRNIPLPIADREFYVKSNEAPGYPSPDSEDLPSYGSLLQAGQPEWIHERFSAAIKACRVASSENVAAD